MKSATQKITLEKASARKIIAGLKIVRAEERRARAAVISARRTMGIQIPSTDRRQFKKARRPTKLPTK